MASTYAPDRLKAARLFLLEHLDMHPGRTVAADLDPAEVGIVGDTAHAAKGSSYHLGRSQLVADSYSIVESSRDRSGLTDAASGLDVGDFAVKVSGQLHTLRTFNRWLVAECKAGASDTADIREVIYSLDGKTVQRWDRLGRRTSGDDSHLWHTHISYFRDSESRDKTGLFRRYLTEIGLLEDDVSWTDDVITNPAWRADAKTNPTVQAKFALYDAWNRVHNVELAVASLAVQLKDLTGKDFVDEAAIANTVLAGLTPANVAAIPEETARRVMELFAARLAS